MSFGKLKAKGEGAEKWNEAVKATNGLQFGAVLNVPVVGLLSVQPELLFVQKGYKMSGGDDKIELKMNYIEVPLLAKLALGTEGLGTYLTAGPALGYWAGGKHKANISNFDTEAKYSFNADDRRVEASANFGLGLAYPVGDKTLNVDFRYSLGLSNLYQTEGSDYVKNRVVGVSAAYLFSL